MNEQRYVGGFLQSFDFSFVILLLTIGALVITLESQRIPHYSKKNKGNFHWKTTPLLPKDSIQVRYKTVRKLFRELIKPHKHLT